MYCDVFFYVERTVFAIAMFLVHILGIYDDLGIAELLLQSL